MVSGTPVIGQKKGAGDDDDDAGFTGPCFLTVIAVPGCTMGNILLTISLSECSGGALPLALLASRDN
jgi:hypothetical protein